MKERTTHDDTAMKKQLSTHDMYVCTYIQYLCKAKSMCVVLQIAKMPIGEV